MNELPVGLFDSGVGGLTVLRAMRACMPGESFLYLGDTARLPYGTKSRDTIARYSLQVTARLVERKIKLLVVACNTATAAALPALRRAYPEIPVIGVVEPGAKAACAASREGFIAVIGTESTIRGRAYDEAILKLRPDARVIGLPCPLFVPLAEDGLVEGPLAEGIAARYLDRVFRVPRERGENIPDCLVLGCTHFPLLADAITHVAGPGVTLVDSAATTARAVKSTLEEHGLRSAVETGESFFLTTDDAERFARMGERFLGFPVPESRVELVDL
ncbi:MAG TPA: glutamate racemase [Candidatus Mailhella excrementigallinarum]|nr:glutamate racemase [Candidatus Mailhella excrementigallinarum]